MNRIRRLAAASLLPFPALVAQCAPTWSELASPSSGAVSQCFVTASGDLVVTGAFQSFAGVAANRIIRRSGGTWSALGAGLDGGAGPVVELPNGDLVVAGSFSMAGNVAAQNIARWNGSTWSPLGTGTNNMIFSLAVLPGGDVIAGGVFTSAGGVPASRIARWNGTTWSALGQGTQLPVSAIAIRQNGDVAFASFDGAHNTLSRLDVWNGSSVVNVLTEIGSQFLALRTMANGDLLLGGSFSTIRGMPAHGLARWSGGSWFAGPLQAFSTVLCIAEMPDGDPVVGGRLTVAGASVRVARIDGTSALALEGPVAFPGNFYGPYGLAVLQQGQLAVGGPFPSIGTTTTPYFAMLDATCPASATPFGAGCTGSGGTNQLTATALPWLGGTFRSRGTGMPGLGVVALVTGFTQFAIPLGTVFPLGGAGCTGYVAADWIEIALPSGGRVDGQLPIPANPVFLGAVFHQYALTLETDGLGNLTAITSSNGLTMTIGSF